MLDKMLTPQASNHVIDHSIAPGIRVGTNQFKSHIVGKANNRPIIQHPTTNPKKDNKSSNSSLLLFIYI